MAMQNYNIMILIMKFLICFTRKICSVVAHNSNLDNSNSRLLQSCNKVASTLYKVETTLSQGCNNLEFELSEFELCGLHIDADTYCMA